MVCLMQKGVGIAFTSLHFVCILDGGLERLYETGRLEFSMGRDYCSECVGILVENFLPHKAKISAAPHYLGDLVGSQWGYFQ